MAESRIPEVDQKVVLDIDDKVNGADGHLIFLGFRGSIAHGTFEGDADSMDDIDLIGVYIASDEHYLGFGSKDSMEFWSGRYDVVLYELGKFVSMLVRQNPNVLSLLWMERPYWISSGAVWDGLIHHREIFASRKAHDSFAGYAKGQIRRMARMAASREQSAEYADLIRQEIEYREGRTDNHPVSKYAMFQGMSMKNLRGHLNAAKGQTGYMGKKRKASVEKHGFDTKHAAHAIRLLRMCEEFLYTGEMNVHRQDARELLDIKHGRWSLEEIHRTADGLFEKCQQAREISPLPGEPDRTAVERVLVDILREHLKR